MILEFSPLISLFTLKNSIIKVIIFSINFYYVDSECPIILKGEDNPNSNFFNRGPGIFINQKTGKISAYYETKENPHSKGMFAETYGKVKEGRWTHITIIFALNEIKIYLNGLLDGFETFKNQTPLQNTHDIFIGGHESYSKTCKIQFGMNHLKIYNKELKIYEIQASVGFPFGVIEPSFIHLACYNCHYLEAKNKCIKGYRLCNMEEIYGGVWQAAQIMGWVSLLNF